MDIETKQKLAKGLEIVRKAAEIAACEISFAPEDEILKERRRQIKERLAKLMAGSQQNEEKKKGEI